MKYFFSVIFLVFFCLLQAQVTVPKFGKIDMSDFQLTQYSKDTSAAAVFLFDDGDIEFRVNNNGSFQYVFSRHFRIKIFKKSALGLADFSISLYQKGSSKEELSNLNASSYNLVDGKVVESKLKNDEIFKETSENHIVKKFALREVRENSIIEISYKITSDFIYNLHGWHFQGSYPRILSQFKVEIPEYFSYRPFIKGYLNFDVNKNETGHFSIVNQNSITATTNITILNIEDVPAFKSEPNIDCEENYIQSIQFELNSVQYPGQLRKDFVQTWESVNKKMIEDEDFGLLLKAQGFIKDTVEILCKDKSTDNEKAHAIYSYIQNRMEWNGKYSIWSLNGLKRPFAARMGNSCEINLLLTIMLKAAGISAEPVMFSTRENGYASPYFPTISNYNSVLTRVFIDDVAYLLDATNKYCPFGVLPPSDINGAGRVVNSLNGDWVDLEATSRYRETIYFKLELGSDGIFSGTEIGKYDGYAGVIYRSGLEKEKNTDDYIRKLQEGLNGYSISKYAIAGKDDINNLLVDTLEVQISDNAELIGDKIIFKPLLFNSIEKNRYTLEERMYPVNYNFPITEMYIYEYAIPEGYEVESLPESKILRLPDNSINITYSVQLLNNKIYISYKRNINKVYFMPDEYQNLKQIYDEMVKKHTEQVILKKTA